MLQFIYPVDITIVLSFDEYLESPEDIKPEDASVFNVLIETRKDIHLIYASIDNTAKQYGSSEINNLQIQIHHNGMVFCSVQAFEERYEQFNRRYPGLINRVKLKYVAAFLGISIYTLSRVRAKK
jgi:hypothetical protein